MRNCFYNIDMTNLMTINENESTRGNYVITRIKTTSLKKISTGRKDKLIKGGERSRKNHNINKRHICQTSYPMVKAINSAKATYAQLIY